ncbi:MAG: hypothetical protein QNJ00_14670 [Woeseiaceae bacterium]|nr:hypothetical protein [Woeseiaceae bacterium]
MEIRNLRRALIASATVAVLITVAFLYFGVSGWTGVHSHPGAWLFAAQAFGLLFLAGALASIATLFLTRK